MRSARFLDVMIRHSEFDPLRGGRIGLSYGGFFPFYTMPLDPRIKAAAASCSIRDREATKEISREGHPAGLGALIAPLGFPIDMVRRAPAEAKTRYAPKRRGDIAWAFPRKPL